MCEEDIKKWLSECVEQGLVALHNDCNCLEIWSLRQRYPSRSKFPDPPAMQMLSKCVRYSDSDSETETESNAGEKRRSPRGFFTRTFFFFFSFSRSGPRAGDWLHGSHLPEALPG